eukprot:CAMPEP_0116937954 /NCGR_PEP_ID=MMETSP0467-20121206/31813_1 /TAXON_ID=283647 /ORGANISM="Mesodinium pulex, Strain SPMC105" /LENGTH=142 /DNA_ID=CAMNT_0004619871 /DNA_START=1132 /DNA_END=1560 /DNA_ORIENTATION=+
MINKIQYKSEINNKGSKDKNQPKSVSISNIDLQKDSDKKDKNDLNSTPSKKFDNFKSLTLNSNVKNISDLKGQNPKGEEKSLKEKLKEAKLKRESESRTDGKDKEKDYSVRHSEPCSNKSTVKYLDINNLSIVDQEDPVNIE